MLVYLNFRARGGAYGGANAFLRTLVAELERRGVRTTSDEGAPFDVALLNALTDGLDLASVRRLAERGKPLVHRKTGYRGRGSVELRSPADGVPLGDRLQLELGPYLAHTIFQSAYSRDIFGEAGFRGAYSVVHNGADPSVFSVHEPRFLRAPRERSYWRPGEPLQVVVSTWSADEHKGFPEYRRIDRALRGHGDVRLTLIGRTPPGAKFEHVRVVDPQPPRRLARRLRRAHVILQLAEWETCSNALIEGLSCGLPAVYLDSGANAEIAAPYGVAYDGDLHASLQQVRERYEELVQRLRDNPYRIGPVADTYLEILDAVASNRTPRGAEILGGGV